MKLSLAWLLVAAPLFGFIGSLIGVPNLGEQFEGVIPHLEAVVNFILLFAPLLGGWKLFRHVPGEGKK